MTRRHTRLILVMATALMAGSAIAEDNHEKHEHSFTKDIDAFHAVLAPLWHARAGKERSQKVCAQADKLENLTTQIRSGDAKTLLAAVAALKVQCKASPADIDTAFSQVHEAFHRLAEPEEH